VDEDQDQGDKTEEATQHRIDEFRKRGEVASSKELTSILVLCAAITTLALTIAFIYEEFSLFVEWLYTLDIATAYTEKKLILITKKTAVTALYCVGPIFAMVFCIGIVANVSQIGFLYSPDVLQLKFERVNPLSGFKRLFSMKSFVEAIKGIFKFSIILFIVYFVMKDGMDSYRGFLHLNFISGFSYAQTILLQLVFTILIGLVVVAIGDFAYQKISYRNKLRMTKEQAKKEHKEQEGSPELKQRIKMVQREMAQKRMMADIPTADVIVTNPTHISIALKYDTQTMISPIVIGKGADHMAFQIRKLAKEHNIPLVENVPLARSIYKSVKVGGVIPRDLYKAVAEVLAFVYKLKKKAKALES